VLRFNWVFMGFPTRDKEICRCLVRFRAPLVESLQFNSASIQLFFNSTFQLLSDNGYLRGDGGRRR
jgi:hypothetical protein